MASVVLLIHILIAICLIGLILLQQGKGAQMGAAFGSGASNTLFGSRGPAGFLMKLTATLIALFFITSILLGRIAANEAKAQGALTAAPTTQIQQMAPPAAQAPAKNTKTLPAKSAPANNSILPPAATTKTETKTTIPSKTTNK